VIFLVTVDGVGVEDGYEVAEGTLQRTVAWEAGAKEPGWSHPAGVMMSEVKGAKANQRVFVYSWK
jgi:hypothetical protein